MNLQPDAINDKLWKRLRYRGAPIKQHVLGSFIESAAPFRHAVDRLRLRSWAVSTCSEHTADDMSLKKSLILDHMFAPHSSYSKNSKPASSAGSVDNRPERMAF